MVIISRPNSAEVIPKTSPLCGIAISLKLLRIIAVAVCSCFATFWMYKTVIKYNSKPITSTVSIITRKTFTWPTISICPHWKCFSEVNASDIRLCDRLDILSSCKQTIYMDQKSGDCLKDTEYEDQWETYFTRDGICQSFTLKPAKHPSDKIEIFLDSRKCFGYYIAIHPHKDRFYSKYELGPTNKLFELRNRSTTTLTLKIEQYDRINRTVSPCIQDTQYSQNECYEMKIREQLVRKTGCYVPTTSENSFAELDPECKNSSGYVNSCHQLDIDWGDPEKSNCLPSCHLTIYKISDKIQKGMTSHRNINTSRFELKLAGDAMYYLQVKEELSMTLDDVIGNIGGTLGLFLGASFLSGISLLEFLANKVQVIYSKFKYLIR